MKNIDTLESILERFRDETGRYIVDSIFLRQALNLYIEDRERLARINELAHLKLSTVCLNKECKVKHQVKVDYIDKRLSQLKELEG